MRVLVLRQKVSILVVFHGRPQLIGLSLRAHVLNSAKKGMDSFPGHIYMYICIYTLPCAVCVYIRARKTFKEEERESWGKEQRRERESQEKRNRTFGEDELGGAEKVKKSSMQRKFLWIFRFFFVCQSSCYETVT